MKAIILAGGKGTRLWPLTEKKPKPMARIMDVPIIVHTLRTLARAGVTDAALTLGTMADEIMGYVGYGHNFGLSLSCFVEDRPLGTAGSVKAVRSFIGADESFLIVSGDALFNFDLSEAIRLHAEKGADALILLNRSRDPSEYGAALLDSDMKITGFIEKPSYTQSYSDLVNTGIYVMKTSVLDMIPENTMYDFSKDLFPRMMESGMSLYGHIADGYWCDIGDPDMYLLCHRDILSDVSGIGRDILGDNFLKKYDELYKEEYRNVNIIPPVYIGRGVKIDERAVIGPYAVIGSGCDISKEAQLRDCVVGSGTVVGVRANIRGCIIDSGCTIEDDALVSEGCVIGTGCRITHGTSLASSSILAPDTVSGDTTGTLRVTSFGARAVLDMGFDMSDAFMFGCALSSFCKDEAVLLGDCGCSEASFIRSCVSLGLCASGVSVFETNDVNLGACGYITKSIGAALGVYFECMKGEVRITILGERGLPVSYKFTEKLKRLCKKRRSPDFSSARVLHPSHIKDARMLYIDELSRRHMLTRGAILLTGRGADFELAKLIFERMGIACDSASSPDVYCISDGVLEIITKKNEVIRGDRLMLLCASIAFKEGCKEFIAPDTAVRELDIIAKHGGGRIRRAAIRESTFSSDEDVSEYAYLSLDPVAQLCHIACHALANNTDVSYLMQDIPSPHVSRRDIDCHGSTRAELMRRLLHKQSGGICTEGVKFERERGCITVVPDEDEEKLVLISQGDTQEYAAELCDFFDDVICECIRESGDK